MNRLSIAFRAIFLSLLTTWSTQAGAAPIAIAGQRQLFVDDYLVGSMNGLQRVLGTPQKSASSPVYPRVHPWEASRAELYGSAIWNPQQKRFELYYSAMSKPYDSRLAVAYSLDAIHWTAPQLNLYSFGSKPLTNIVYEMPANDPGIQGQYAHMGPWVHGPSVIYDAHESNVDRRYKMITNAGNGYLDALFSPDGVHWSSYANNPVISVTSDTGNCLLWDAKIQKYVLYTRSRDRSGVREVSRAESSDFISWSQPAVVDSPSAADRAKSLEFYGHSVTPYQGVYIGLTWLFPNTPASVNANAGTPVTWPVLSVSRDGIHWQRVSDQPFLPLGAAGSFDSRQIRLASSLVETQENLILMYSGSPDAHVSGMRADIGQASIRLDGFASLTAGAAEGTLVTKPLSFSAGELYVNAVVRSGGYIRVGLVDAQGNSISGYTTDLSSTVTGDALGARVTWSGKPNLPDSLPDGVSLKFTMKDADLYSFQMVPAAAEPKTCGLLSCGSVGLIIAAYRCRDK